MNPIKRILWSARDISFLFAGVTYDFWRYVIYSSSYFRHGASKRSYRAVKAYHSIEKSLSFKNRTQGSGWNAARDLYYSIMRYKPKSEDLAFHEIVGISVVQKLLAATSPNTAQERQIASDLGQMSSNRELGGIVQDAEIDLGKGVLPAPEDFFLSRYSVREFLPKAVDQSTILRALKLASKTPSVCNRESYFVYHIEDILEKKKILDLQNGNRGFGEAIPTILIITVDLGAFISQIERNQYWIDSGMYAMSLVYAFHSLGLGTCCLNWSQSFLNDIRARKALPISGNHSITMLLAVGYPAHRLNACASLRSPVEEHIKHLEGQFSK